MLRARVIALCCVATSAFCADLTTDPVLGSWQLNNAKSLLTPSSPPVSVFRSYQAGRDGFIHISETRLDAKGAKIEINYAVSYDGEEYPLFFRASDTHVLVKSNETVSFRRVDQRTVRGVFRTQGIATHRFTRTVSKDGQQLRVLVVRIHQPKTVTLLVYERAAT
jgi:hypothetical protein